MWVCHQAREDLDQLSLEVGMELGLYVEPVHVGEDGDYATNGMEVLDKGLDLNCQNSENQ